MNIQRHHNNFDFLRFVFASFVIITHSFALLGMEKKEWMLGITNGQISFSQLGLAGFFTISGYFIYKSMLRSDSVLHYLKKRVLRLFPALLVVLLFSLVVLPFFYRGDKSIFNEFGYWTYLPYNLSLYLFQGPVEGVFNSLPYRSFNGSLWTIRYEFSMYLFVLLFFFIKKARYHRFLATFLLILWYVIFTFGMNRFGASNFLGMTGYPLFNLGGYFVAGIFLGTLQRKLFNDKRLLLFALILLVISAYYGMYGYVKHVALSFLILGLGFWESKLAYFKDYGDPSYGIYIYAFPIQQILIYCFSPSLEILLLGSFSLAVFFGYISWHLIEKRALSIK